VSEPAGSVTGLSLEQKRALAAELLRRREERVQGLSCGQQAWWFLHRLQPGNPAYGIPFVARVRSRVDVALLRRCLGELTRRHAVLRTTYTERGSGPVQVVRAKAEPHLETRDASGRSWPEVMELLTLESRRPFDLERGPVLRVTLASRAEDDHGLLLMVHHIAADLWSFVILLRELRTLYDAARQGWAVELPPLPRQYVDFARAEAEMLASARGERMWEFWRDRLADAPVLALPTDRPRRAARSDRGEAYDLPIDAGLAGFLRSLSAESGATFFMTLLAAWEVLLHRHTGQRDLVVGTLAAKGRGRPELAGVVGFLDNPVALRESVDSRSLFTVFLERVRQTVLDAMEHQEYPFSRLVERLQPVREAARSALFQCMFILQAPHLREETDLLQIWLGAGLGQVQAVDFGGLRLEPARLDRGAATALAGQLDLTLAVADLGGRLAASFQYNPDLFERATVARLALQFQSLLEAVAAGPAVALGDLPLLGAAERHQIVTEWNDTREDLPADVCLHHLFEAWARRRPEAPAVLGGAPGSLPLSYGELDRRADRLARRLAQLGVGPEVRVGVFAEPSPETVSGLLGILKAGGAYVPLDPRYPRERRSFLLRDAGVGLVLAQERLGDELPGEIEVLSLDGDVEPAGGRRPAASLDAGHLAYVIYTSGSTGRPKGVMIDHRAAVNTVLDVNARFGVGPDDRVFAVSSLSFDLSVYDVFGILAAGGAIVLPQPSATPSPALWLESLERHGVTVWNSAPALLEMLKQHMERVAAPLPSTLRLVMLSGDWIPVALPDQVRSRAERAEVMSLGGATEASIWSIYHPVERPQPERVSIPYGRPLANQRFHVLDADLRPAPVGVVGDLYIGGVGVARGYQSRPDLTADRFLPDPFGAREGGAEARLYRTGDLGRYLPDGEIEFLGRADHQVKIRGFRVELGEIEAQIARHPGVREALAVVRDDTSGGRQVVAYYKGDAEEEAVRRHLRQTLPDYMVPPFLVRLDAFPLTHNGKVDRRGLPAPVPAQGRGSGGPRPPAEEILAAVWGEVLGLPAVGPDDNFFALGGHSLKATQVAIRIQERLGVDLPLRRIFEAATLAELAAAVEAASREGGGLAIPPIEPVFQDGREGRELPLSFAQERMWMAEQLEPGTGAYNMAVGLAIRGPLGVPVLARALAGIVARHEALRTRFLATESGPVQVVEPRVALGLPVVDLSALPEALRPGELKRLSGEAARHPFDLTTAPLLQTALVHQGRADHLLLISMHHIVSDGWSMGVFLQELARLYADFAVGGTASLAPLPIQYTDFAHWQREWLQGEALEPLLAYWRRRLASAPAVLELLADRPRPPVRSLRGASRSRLLPPALHADLKVLSQRHGVTLFMTLLAAFQVLLSRYSGQQDILVGTDTANRNRREIEGLIGFFVNNPVLRTDLSGNPTFAELLERVRVTTLEAYAHQDLPFEKLVEELRPERDLSRTPIFQVLFVLQNVPLGNLRASGLSFTPLAVESGRCKFDLILMMWEIEEGLQETWTYSTDLFDEPTIARMSGHLEALLRQAAARPEARLNDLEMLTERERERHGMERQQRQNLEASTLRMTRRRAVDLSSVSPVATRVLERGETRCLVVEPARSDADLVSWVRAEPDFIETHLRTYGSILFRDFPVGGVADFEGFAQAVCPELFGEYGDLPRAGLGGKVYTSTPYPPDQWILYHNESSHMDSWPLKQFFHCVRPPDSGGDTPIADCRRVYQRLAPEIRRAFAEKGVMYVRNFTPGIDVSWQEFFHTSDRAEVEAACRAAGLDVEWKADGALRTRRVCPAVARHPKTGEEVFFNQIQAHHISCLDPEVRESLLALFADDALPRNVYFGDGSRIETAMLEEIIGVYHEVALRFPWQKGDILLVDNMLTAHSRAPFTGERKIVVAMGEMVSHDRL
jgi:amino acid adenylation domain-containing protein